jgi:hypothetical protein
VFETRVLRRIFAPEMDKVMGGQRKRHKKELHDLYSLPKIIRIIKLRRMSWVGHVACVSELLDNNNMMGAKTYKTWRDTISIYCKIFE